MLAYIQIYFLSSSESNGHDVTNINNDDAILKPWINHLKNLNTRLLDKQFITLNYYYCLIFVTIKKELS